MRILALLLITAFLVFYGQKTESPHGTDFKVTCSTCHSSKGWMLDTSIYSFDHGRTMLPLTGQHTLVGCRECHKSLVFSQAKSECNECHSDVHQGTTGLDCSRCHTPASWLVSDITRIHETSRFPLLGAHKMADCVECHKSESLVRFDVPGVNCDDCHRENYNSTTNPNHVEAGFSEECYTCHPVNAFQWTGAGFSHNSFPLTQGHSGINCTVCHTTGNYADASTACYSCHQNDYLGTTNPNHAASNFPTNCEKCHTLAPGWKPATFDHSIFPLTLGHSGVACESCHVNGNYSTVSSDCISCHQTDYNTTTNPNHQSLSFSTVCTTCHTTNPGWKPAKYAQHDSQFFPIYSGRHNGTWTLCSECHTDPNNYALFDCKRCHSNVHQGKNYTNDQCYSCHPTGSGGGK
jgi:hypothetical protein